MRLDIDKDGVRILICTEDELGCSICRSKDNPQDWYYCEQEKRIYCRNCIDMGFTCRIYYDHHDWKIDYVKIVKICEDKTPHHNLNIELIETENG